MHDHFTIEEEGTQTNNNGKHSLKRNIRKTSLAPSVWVARVYVWVGILSLISSTTKHEAATPPPTPPPPPNR
jgi:hypothetical protein